MNLSVLGAVILGVLVVVALIYSEKAAKKFPHTKPLFAWLPKYNVPMPAKVLADLGRVHEALTAFGFEKSRKSAAGLRYKRGSVVGDFSIKVAQVVVVILPDAEQMEVRYGAFAVFDTGDLWTFASELRQKLVDDTASPR